MKKSLSKLIIFSILPLLVICYAIYLTGKKTDDFYKRFSSPQQNSLILGSSRAASMNPKILDSIINKNFPEAQLYDYAFTWAHSPYGPKYLESIKKKVKEDTKNGVFILTVEPTAMMVDKNLPDSPEYYFENDKSVAKTSQVASNPNIEYLLESYDFSLTKEVNKKILPEKNAMADVEILDNGKIDIRMLKYISPGKRTAENKVKMKEFQQRLEDLKISENRIKYLSQTIDFLGKHGSVIVVRMPIGKTPYLIEGKFYPDFDQRIGDLCKQKKVGYINYNNFSNDYEFGDEVHLVPQSMDIFSKVLGKDILLKY